MYRLWWISSDKQGSMDGGEFETEEAAESAIPEWAEELLDQCQEEDRQGIKAGTFAIEEISETMFNKVASRWRWSDLELLKPS